MFGIGFTELLLVLVVALLVLGPDRLPEVARTMAKAYNEFRRTGMDLKRTVEGAVKGVDISNSVKQGPFVAKKAGEGNLQKEDVPEADPDSGAEESSKKAT